MARSLATEVTTALAARTLVPRDFLWIVARDRDTGEQKRIAIAEILPLLRDGLKVLE